MTRPDNTKPFYFVLPSGAGTATIHLPANATAEDVQSLARFVFTSETQRLAVADDYRERDRGDAQRALHVRRPRQSITASDKEGVLQLQASGRWAVCRQGREPVEITSGHVFRVEAKTRPGVLTLTSMEYRHSGRGGGAYYSVDGFELYNGQRAAFGPRD
jgi:hypothetical protein